MEQGCAVYGVHVSRVDVVMPRYIKDPHDHILIFVNVCDDMKCAVLKVSETKIRSKSVYQLDFVVA